MWWAVILIAPIALALATAQIIVLAVQNRKDRKETRSLAVKESPFSKICPPAMETLTPEPGPSPTPSARNPELTEKGILQAWVKKNAGNLLNCLEKAENSFTIEACEFEDVSVKLITEYLMSIEKIESVCYRDGNIICSINKTTA